MPALECRNHEAEYVMDYLCTYSTSGADPVALGVGFAVSLLMVVLAVLTWAKYRHQIQNQLATYRRNYRVRQQTG